MTVKNRLMRNQPDYIFAIVRKPPGWLPAHFEDAPRSGEELSRDYVASYEEAHDDLVRCNKLSLRLSLDKWAVIRNPDGGL